MKGISNELNQVIADEVSAKQALEVAKDICECRRPITRRKIEELRELKELEDNWINE